MSQATAIPNEIIVCRVTNWYYRRMGLLAAMFLGMGLYFFYDGRIGYVKDNEVAAKKEWFEKEVIEGPDGYEAAKLQGEEFTQEWVKMARERGWIVSAALQEPRWNDYAAPHGWAENPKKHSADEIEQQYYWGGAMIFGAAITGLLVLLSHNKVLTGHADHMVMPNGSSVRFADVTKVDKRKWDNKGLAYAYHRAGNGSAARRVIIDDLKFHGAGRVLDRLLSQFSGELIEKVPDEDDDLSKPATEGETSPKDAA